ncbi:hypothetical protein BKK81_17865 [Cupriavidus sp. USMAHM13]|uniref:arsenic resistance N-acetyltransferase ArsN2 n=1 Tax=Cupriavidus sp. USMAHM13 TaxID=1389192 RepID=UPI0008A6B40B|nr:arsenic resistance N-acetyltransferase ArsN2 [Cupriavidus sp. USMAHM13]AOZ00905.1 hypothetical protein BKK81_17865 [Cupriavidus sp. USMAHM13]
MSVIYRKATHADLSAITTLLNTAKLPLEGVVDHIGDFRVAVTADGVLVGCAGMERYGTIALLRSVACAPAYRNAGLAGALIGEILGDAKQSGAIEVYLLTTTAPRYFDRLGFEEISREKLPVALSPSRELQGACPAQAIAMRLAL